jgi:hypothetical protein
MVTAAAALQAAPCSTVLHASGDGDFFDDENKIFKLENHYWIVQRPLL